MQAEKIKMKKGRYIEVEEIVKYKRAAFVGRMLLGEINNEMERIDVDEFIDKPRKEIKTELEGIKKKLQGEINKFCRQNFEGLTPLKLSNLYEPLFENSGIYKIPLTEFIEKYGKPKKGVLKNAPLHSTIHISNWGLQSDYPERHLVNDIIVSFNTIIKVENKLKKAKESNWEEIKDDEQKKDIKNWLMTSKANKRFCLLSCFNLVESYINGISWNFSKEFDLSILTSKKQNILTEGERPVNIIDKLIKAPKIIGNKEHGLLQTQEPLKTFIEIIKPYRDSIVHASPFSAPIKFGGYNKLDKLYSLEFDIVLLAVEKTFELIEEIHKITNEKYSIPTKVIEKNDDGSYTLMEEIEVN